MFFEIMNIWRIYAIFIRYAAEREPDATGRHILTTECVDDVFCDEQLMTYRFHDAY